MATDSHDAHDTADTRANGHHDQAGPDNDAPLVRPDGTISPPRRPLPLAVGISGTILFLLILAGLIFYANRNGGGAAPEAPTGQVISVATDGATGAAFIAVVMSLT